MTNQSTMDKLIEMRLTTTADAFRNQLNDPKFKEVPFEDQFGMLVDIEYSSRKNNRLKVRRALLRETVLMQKQLIMDGTQITAQLDRLWKQCLHIWERSLEKITVI